MKASKSTPSMAVEIEGSEVDSLYRDLITMHWDGPSYPTLLEFYNLLRRHLGKIE